MEYLSLEELSNELSISVATAKNWLRLGKITFQKTKGNAKYFSREYIEKLLLNIRQSDDNVLKSRRNKNYIKGNFFYKDYVSAVSKNIKTVESLLNTLSLDGLKDEDYTKYIVADCAIQLLVQAKKIPDVKEDFLLNYLFVLLVFSYLPRSRNCHGVRPPAGGVSLRRSEACFCRQEHGFQLVCLTKTNQLF